MRITSYAGAGATVTTFDGRLDASTAPQAEAALTEALAKGSVIADFAQVAYVSSAGLRVLLKASKQATATKHRFVICGLQPSVREVFEISGFERFIPLFANLAEASAAG